MPTSIKLGTSIKKKQKTLSAKVKQGLAHAFTKFNEFQLRKHAHSDRAVKLRDVLFLTHAKPKDEEQAAMWKRLIAGELSVPDTWETALSSGADKKETFERLIREEKLGALAFVRNLRNMHEAKVSRGLISEYAERIDVSKVFPWQFIAAAKFAPWYEPELEKCMLRASSFKEKLPGKTILMIDHSGSMREELSAKSEMTYSDAACGVAMMLRELCDDAHVFTFSNNLVYVPPRRGFALRDAIHASQHMAGTYLTGALSELYKQDREFDRIIIITDEQSHDGILKSPTGKGYVVNIASNRNGVGYGDFTHINGFSANVLDYIREDEALLK